MTCMVSSRPKQGTRPVFNLFGSSNHFLTQKVYFSRLMRVCVGLIMLVHGLYLVQVSLLLIGQQAWGHFFRYRSLLPIGKRSVQIVRQRRRKITNTAPTTLIVQYKQQANPPMVKTPAVSPSIFLSRTIFLVPKAFKKLIKYINSNFN